MKITDLIDQYEQGAKLRGLAPTQLNALKPVRRGLGWLPAKALKPERVSEYVAQRRAGCLTEAHAKKPAADGTIRRELGALSAVLNWGHSRGILKDAPPKIDLPKASPPREVFLTKDEADMLWGYGVMAAERGAPVGLFTCLALDTWARADAIETLPWERVTTEQIDYRDPAKPETRKRRVPVPVSTRLRDALLSVPEEKRNGLVCGPVTQYEWQKFKKHVALPGGKDYTRHDLRRTGISLALARGVEPLKVAMMAGDDLSTIMKHYARFAPDYLAGVVE